MADEPETARPALFNTLVLPAIIGAFLVLYLAVTVLIDTDTIRAGDPEDRIANAHVPIDPDQANFAPSNRPIEQLLVPEHMRSSMGEDEASEDATSG